jgi:hypothetical protein
MAWSVAYRDCRALRQFGQKRYVILSGWTTNCDPRLSGIISAGPGVEGTAAQECLTAVNRTCTHRGKGSGRCVGVMLEMVHGFVRGGFLRTVPRLLAGD